MPPRIPPTAASLPLPSAPSIQTHCKSCLRRTFSSSPAALSEQTKLRQQFWAWMRGPGDVFRYPLPGSTNYLSAYDRTGNLLRTRDQKRNQKANSPEGRRPSEGDMTEDAEALEAAATETEGRNARLNLPPETMEDLRPFPLNKNFISQSILSEELRMEIYDRVQKQGKSVRQVSVEMGVDMRRVAAVVRLVEVEKRMIAEGKQLANPYARAVHGMVPLTNLNSTTRLADTTHETINDLEQHPLTYPQLFYPTSESRAFNRTDAGRAFSGAPRLPEEPESAISDGTHEAWRDSRTEIIGRPGKTRPVLKPADSRIPHPQLIAFEKDKLDNSIPPLEVRARHRERLRQDEEKMAFTKARKRAEEEATKTRIDVGRWQLVVTEVQSTREGVGLDGRGSGRNAVGQRYGVPSQERKKGRVKIPTKVEV